MKIKKIINLNKIKYQLFSFSKSFKMVEKENTLIKNNVQEILKQRQENGINNVVSEFGRKDDNLPEVPKVQNKIVSFDSRIRIINLVGADAEKFIGKTITVAGWAKSIRDQGKGQFTFVMLNDGSTIKNFQVVVSNVMPDFAKMNQQGVGASFKFKGLIVKSEGSKQPIEMQVNEVEAHKLTVVGECNPSEYVLHKSKPTLETLRDICHLRPRTNTISCVARIRNAMSYATHQFFQMRGFNYVHTPIITASDCEGAGEMFQVTTVLPNPKEKVEKLSTTKEGLVDYDKDFFKKPSFLTVSGQLAVENYACALSDVYTFGPTFRAENSHTTRHLAEFWMIEPEMCFADIYDDMELGENYLKYCLKYALENNLDDLEFFDSFVEKGLIERLKNVVNNDFVKITYTECIEILKEAVEKDKKLFADEKKKKEKKKKEEKKDGENKEGEKTEEKVEEKKEEPKVEVKKDEKRNIFWGMDMASEHERYLTEVVFKKPIIVFNYPKDIKSFYMKINEDKKTVAAMDILVPKIGEIIGGSQREDNFETLTQVIKDKGLDPAGYWWYLELRKYGSVPHSGFGLGFERLIMMVTGIENIRDVIPYPRYPDHADF